MIRTGTGQPQPARRWQFRRGDALRYLHRGDSNVEHRAQRRRPLQFVARTESVDGSGTILGNGTAVMRRRSRIIRLIIRRAAGNLLVSVQGDLTGDYLAPFNQNNVLPSNTLGNWLWTQGGAVAGQAAAWWINFGTYTNQSSGEPISWLASPASARWGRQSHAQCRRQCHQCHGGGREYRPCPCRWDAGRDRRRPPYRQCWRRDQWQRQSLRRPTWRHGGQCRAVGTIVPGYGANYGYSFGGQGISDPRYISPLTGG